MTMISNHQVAGPMQASRLARILKPLTIGLAALGAGTGALLAAGLVLDLQSFDRTRGGYVAPFENYSGQPTDWSRTDRTTDGMARRGFVTTLLVNCTTGMISVEVFRQVLEFRVFSPRAIVIHKPREACRDRGFSPRF